MQMVDVQVAGGVEESEVSEERIAAVRRQLHAEVAHSLAAGRSAEALAKVKATAEAKARRAARNSLFSGNGSVAGCLLDDE